MSKRRKKVFLFNSDNELIKEFATRLEAKLFFKISYVNLLKALNIGEIMIENKKFYLRNEKTKKD